MNAILNYLVEANLGLCLMLLMYVLFLRGETDFTVKRKFLVISVAASVLFPLIQIGGTRYAYLPSLMDVLPTTWLPEVVVTARGASSAQTINFDAWLILTSIYAIGAGAAFSIFIIRLCKIAGTLRSIRPYRLDSNLIFESDENKSSFSFFQCIYIGQASDLTTDEKAMVIHHEQIHGRQLHSFDIMLINLAGIFFWFNPVISIYKKIFVQLHEFEADARSVSTRDVDNYCSLLAKVALLSADFKLANHFSNSLTVKRIEMMRTIKAKIKRWKYVAFAAVLPSFFFVVACQEQVMSEMTDVAKNSNNTMLVPDHIQARYDELKKANPDSRILLVNLNDQAVSQMQELEKKYGMPKSMEVFKSDDQIKKEYPNMKIDSNDQRRSGDGHNYAILEYTNDVGSVMESAKTGDQVYSMVDEPAEYPGGINALMEFLSANLVYPEVARTMGIEGSVYVRLVIEKDGSISEVTTVKGVSQECDAEAIRVVSMFPKWTPGKMNGNVVRSAFVIPVKYKLG